MGGKGFRTIREQSYWQGKSLLYQPYPACLHHNQLYIVIGGRGGLEYMHGIERFRTICH